MNFGASPSIWDGSWALKWTKNYRKTENEYFISDTIRKRVGERIHSRLKEMCYFENLIGKDRRISEDEIDEEESL